MKGLVAWYDNVSIALRKMAVGITSKGHRWKGCNEGIAGRDWVLEIVGR